MILSRPAQSVVLARNDRICLSCPLSQHTTVLLCFLPTATHIDQQRHLKLIGIPTKTPTRRSRDTEVEGECETIDEGLGTILSIRTRYHTRLLFIRTKIPELDSTIPFAMIITLSQAAVLGNAAFGGFSFLCWEPYLAIRFHSFPFFSSEWSVSTDGAGPDYRMDVSLFSQVLPANALRKMA